MHVAHTHKKESLSLNHIQAESRLLNHGTCEQNILGAMDARCGLETAAWKVLPPKGMSLANEN